MITYADKVQNAVNPLPVDEQWRAVDANEVKNEVNANITATATAQATADAAQTSGEVTTAINATVGTATQTALDLKLEALVTIQSKTATYTLVSGDLTNVNLGKNLMFVMNVATDNDFEIPLNATVAFPVGTIIGVRKIGAGITTITGVVGVTLAAPLSAFDLVNAQDTAYVEKIATDSWVANGQLSL